YKVVTTGSQYYTLAGYFAFGAIVYRFRGRVWIHPAVAAAFALLAVATARSWAGPMLLPLAVGYAILTLALHPSVRMPVTWLHRNDYSYGTYLYGFPVQQALIALGARDPLLLFGCSACVTLACAALSWHVVEQPLLHWKGRISDRLRRVYPRAAAT
ncbi:MAG: hypothetical protein ABI831_14335, partial [Betaproteobacteria bacterium]